ncbi:leucine-rich_repeat domain-containing protein [Hexamita inflata]|uniref:Leucine-rich repeat domain-containing protein n=1 Tax=Hexamita inflata TaxID=28002 RepID=A0AA86RHC1_9EUKA|nr:leucine-rich repeat domain-containing protein [Hexamita inflata]
MFKNKTEEMIQNGPAKYDLEMTAKYRGAICTGYGLGPQIDISKSIDVKDLKFADSINAKCLNINDGCVNINFFRVPITVTVIVLRKSQIKSIKGIEQMTQLEQLYLENNSIVNINSLKNLSKLTQLYLSNNKIIDFSPIELHKTRGCYCNLSSQTQPTQQEIDESKLQ